MLELVLDVLDDASHILFAVQLGVNVHLTIERSKVFINAIPHHHASPKAYLHGRCWLPHEWLSIVTAHHELRSILAVHQ